MRRASDIPHVPARRTLYGGNADDTDESYPAGSRGPERSAAKHWCRRHSKRSPRITAKQAFPTWHGSTAFRWHMSASACVPRPDAPIRNCCKSTVWRPLARLLRRSDMNIQQIISLVGYENTSISTACSTSGMVSARGNTGWCAPAMAAPAHKVLALKAGTAAHRFSRKCSSPCFLPFWSILRYFGAGTGFLW